MTKKHKSLLLLFDRILAQDLLRQVFILVALLFLIFLVSFFLLSISGNDWLDYCQRDHVSKWVFPLYLLIDGNAFHDFCSNKDVSALTVFIACLIYITGVVIFTGMIISVMTNMIERRVENHREGHIYYMKSGHYIIMGYDEMVPSFIKYIFNKPGNVYVLILTSVKASIVKEKLRKSFNEEEMKRIIINYGHRTTTESYNKIHLEAAEEIFIVGYHSNPAHDAINIECVDCICEYLAKQENKSHPGKITCVFKDIDTYGAFKTSELFRDSVAALGIEFIPYNFYIGWAKQFFVRGRHDEKTDPISSQQSFTIHRVNYPSIYGQGITPDDPRYVHLVFVGTTNFAVAFAMEAAHVLHFPNYNRDNTLKTRISFIDINADKEKDEFITRNRHFFEIQSYRYQNLSDDSENTKTIICEPTYFKGEDANFLDVEFEFIKGNIFSNRVQEEICRWALEKDKQYLSIFLSMENQRSNFAIGMNMPDEVYDNAIPLYIRQDRSDNFVTNLREADSKYFNYIKMQGDNLVETQRAARYAHIYPFGMNETAYQTDNYSLKRAKIINYLYNTADYRNYKFKDILELDAIPNEKLWDDANRMWNDLYVALKWSNMYCSYSLRTKLATLRAMRGLHLYDRSRDTEPLTDYEVEELAKVEHNRWNVEKLLMGYRKPHPEEDKYQAKDEEQMKHLNRIKRLLIHSDIRPYDQLNSIKVLDRELARYIPWIMRMTES